MTDDPVDRWTRELRDWARRPARLSPAAARTRVLAGLGAARRRPPWRLVTAGASLAALGLAVALTLGREERPATTAPQPAAASEQMIVHQLSTGTKLYIFVRPGALSDDR